MSRLPHICFVALEAWPVLVNDKSIPVVGGAEVQQHLLARALIRRGYTVSMICLDHGQGDGVMVDGIRVFRAYAPSAGISGLRFLHPRLTSVWDAMKRVNADIYYQRTAGMLAGVVAAFCRFHRRKAVYAGASDVDFVPGQETIEYLRDRLIFRWGVRHADLILTQNATQQKSCHQHYGRESLVIPNAYEEAGTTGNKDGVVLWVATIRQYKDPERFIELARSLPAYRFRMVGGVGGTKESDIAYYENIRKLATAVPNLEFVGFVPYSEIDMHFEDARVFVNTSKFEGFPNTLLQAWSRRIPVVVFGRLGVEVPACVLFQGDGDKIAFRREVEKLSSDDDWWQDQGQSAYDHFQSHYSIQRIGDRYAALFSDLSESLASEPGRAAWKGR